MRGGEKQLNKKIALTAAAVSILGAGILSASTAFAQSDTATNNPMDSLVQKIADKFNLNKQDVQAVFDEAHQARETGMEANFEKQLSQYVTDGKITEAQKQLIVKKHAEMKADREQNKGSFKNLSATERKAQMESKRTELDTWAKQNGIDMQYLMPMGNGRGHGGPEGFGQRGADTQATAAPTQSQ